MKIVFIAKFKNVWDEEPIAKAFEANGVEVIRMEDRGHANSEYLQRIEGEKPDFVLFMKLSIQESARDLLQSIKDLGVPTVSWTFDLLLGHPPREQAIKDQGTIAYEFLNADYVFLTDNGHTEDYKKIGVNKLTERQGVPEEYCYMAEEEKIYDVLFVGTHNSTYPYRQRVMNYLSKMYGDRFHWVGKADPTECRGHDLNKLIGQAKVVIGSSMWAPDYWSNRVYEMLGRGAFLITPQVPGLEKEFEYYKELVPYKLGDFSGLIEKIDYYLKNDEAREAIGKAGFERVKSEYLFKDRVADLLKQLKKLDV